MCDFIVPPSPSWYLSNIITCSEDGKTVVYGARHELVIIKLCDPSKNGKELHFSFIPMAHKDKVTSVAFPPSYDETFKNHILSSSDDGTVRIWNFETQMLKFSHSGHPEGHKIPCADWSKADSNLVVSISDMGSIVCWDLVSNTIRKLYTGTKVLPITLTCNPHNKDIIAIGAKAGLIVIYNIKGDGEVVFRLRGHETDVISLAFCPVPYNIFKEDKSDNTHLLASGSKDRIIYFWKTGTDGRFETCITLPAHPMSGQRNKNGMLGAGGTWTCVRWPEENTFFTSSLTGELLSYDLRTIVVAPKGSDILKKKCKVSLVHSCHSKGLFSIAVSKPVQDDKSDILIWTSALDKHLICTRFKEKKYVQNITTIGGIVYCLAVSPLDPNRLAIGTGDNKILIWNLSNMGGDKMLTFWNKINSKVMGLAWHPKQENLIAFGTGEGRVGLLDVGSQKSATLLRLYHRRSVYSLIWAPPIITTEGDDGNKMALFSVGDGEIVQYDPSAPDKEPESLESKLKECDAASGINKVLIRSDICWNHDRSLVAVGNENGCLYILEGKTFNYIHSVFAHKKLVQCAVWHPGTVTSENSLSPYSSWLASASDNVQVINITLSGVSTVATFNDHAERVVSLMWSPHINGRLVTASYDYTAQVWDVISGTMLSRFDEHHGAVVCCLFSPRHTDKVITGGSDYTVRLWDIPEYQSKTKFSSKNKKQRVSGAMKKFEGAREATDLNPPDGKEYKQMNGKPERESTEKEGIVKHRAKSMFPVTSSSMSEAKHLELLWARTSDSEYPHPEPSVSETCYLDFFGDENAMKRLLMVEESHHTSNNNVQNAMHTSLWSGEIADVIREASRKKQLNDWLVSLAPLVSHRLWTECCLSYSGQLAVAGEGLKAASYLLAIHKIEAAVDVLIESKLPREAVALAKSRFPPNDPTVLKAMKAWSHYCFLTGQPVLAAHCLLSIGNNMGAVEMLSRTKHPRTLSLASRIAAKENASNLAESLALRSVTISLSKSDFKGALDTLSYHPSFQDVSLWVKICEILKSWPHLDLIKEEGISWLNGTHGGKDFFQACLDLHSNGYQANAYEVLKRILPTKLENSTDETVWLYIGGQITLAVLSYSQESTHIESIKHIIKALNSTYCWQVHQPLCSDLYLQLSAWLSPRGPCFEIEHFKSCKESLKESLSGYIVCSAVFWLDLLEPCAESLLTDSSTVANIVDTINKCCSLLFRHDIITYFKNEVIIKKLENAIVTAKLDSLGSKDKSSPNKTETVDKSSDLPSDSDHSPRDRTIEIELCEKDRIQSLEELKQWQKVFENDMCNTPNPFVVFCFMINALQNLLTEENKSEEIEKLIINVNEIWKQVSE